MRDSTLHPNGGDVVCEPEPMEQYTKTIRLLAEIARLERERKETLLTVRRVEENLRAGVGMGGLTPTGCERSADMLCSITNPATPTGSER